MKKLFYLLALLSVSVFMISCSDTETGGDKEKLTNIDLASLDSLVGDYVVDNYSIAITTAQTGVTETQSITVAKDNYTLTQAYLSHALITKNGNDLTIASLISNDSIISKVAETNLTADQLKSYPSFYNILVNVTAAPTLAGEKLGDIATIDYEIEKLDETKIKVTYKASKVDGTVTRSENGNMILTKMKNATTPIPAEMKSLYTTYVINDKTNPMAPVGRYAISKYEYVKTGAAAETTTITANPLAATEKNLIGGLSVRTLSVNLTDKSIVIGMDIPMQTDLDGGFKIDVNGEATDTDNKFMFKALTIEVYPLFKIHGLDIAAILTALGATIAEDGKSMALKLTNDITYIKHGFPLAAGDSITFTLQMMNDGLGTGIFAPFTDTKFY